MKTTDFVFQGTVKEQNSPFVLVSILKTNVGTSLVVLLPSSAKDAGSIPGRETKTPQAVGQLSPYHNS